MSQKPNFSHQTIYESFLIDDFPESEGIEPQLQILNLLKMLGFDIDRYSFSEMNNLDTLLSEGEKKKIGLARTLVRNSKIFIFDEPTASLDSIAKDFLREELFKLSKEHLVIVVSHDEVFESIKTRTWILK